MNVLFVGGTGIISSACARLAVARGITVTFFNRGKSARHPAPDGVEILHGDIGDSASARSALGERQFDVVVQWAAFLPAQAKLDVELFRSRTRQYVFISSASAYHKPPRSLPITESTPLHNPFWQYSRDKMACEDILLQAYRSKQFPVTIVRPSHTYDAALLPVHGGGRSSIGCAAVFPSSCTGTERLSGRSRTTTTSRAASWGCSGTPPPWARRFTSPRTRR